MTFPPQRRRDRRYRVRLVFRTRLGGTHHELVAENVSFRGLYLTGAIALPVRQLLRIETRLPPDDVPFATHAMVVHVVPPKPGGTFYGAGLQFYGMGDERRLWERYIQHLQRSAEVMPDLRTTGEVPVVAEPAAASGTRIAEGSGPKDSRRFHRYPVVLEVRPRDIDELLRMCSRDVSIGGMFLTTPREIEVGSELRLDVRHPQGGGVFQLSAVVRRRSKQPLGLGVEFIGLDDRRRAEFFDFIHAPLPAGEPDDFELVES